jgi:hypothetical protein
MGRIFLILKSSPGCQTLSNVWLTFKMLLCKIDSFTKLCWWCLLRGGIVVLWSEPVWNRIGGSCFMRETLFIMRATNSLSCVYSFFCRLRFSSIPTDKNWICTCQLQTAVSSHLLKIGNVFIWNYLLGIIHTTTSQNIYYSSWNTLCLKRYVLTCAWLEIIILNNAGNTLLTIRIEIVTG